MTKLFILKPGEHHFAPGSPTLWNNKTLDDAGAMAMIKMDGSNLQRFESYPKDSYGNAILNETEPETISMPVLSVKVDQEQYKEEEGE